jgi:branched-chain amino acid transport system permease protein
MDVRKWLGGPWAAAFGAVVVYGLIQLLINQGTINVYWKQVIQLACIMAIVSLGLNLIYGYNGQFSLGQWAFYAIGAYSAADVTYRWSTKDASGLLVLSLAVILIALLFWGLDGLLKGAQSGSGNNRRLARGAAYLSVLLVAFVGGRFLAGMVAQPLHLAGTGALVLSVVFIAALLAGLVAILRSRQGLGELDDTAIFALYTLMAIVAAVLALDWGAALGGPVSALLSGLPAEAVRQAVFVLAILLGGALAAEVSFLFGMPIFKLGSDYFGIATLGFIIMVKVLADNSDQVFPEMKGARGMVGIPRMTTWFWVFLFLVLTLITMRNVLHSSAGRAIISVRENEIAARAMGIDVVRYKTMSFVLGSFYAGVAGGLYAHLYAFLHPSTFHFIKSFDPLIIIVFGGLGSMTGTVVGSFVWAFALEGLRVTLPQGAEIWRFVIYPVALLLIMLLRPDGFFGKSELGFLRAKLPPLRKSPEPEPVVSSAPAGGGE